MHRRRLLVVAHCFSNPPVPARLCRDRRLGAGAVEDPRVGLGRVRVEERAARVAAAVEERGLCRGRRRLLRRGRRRRGPRDVAQALVGLGADLLRRARPVAGAVVDVGAERAVGGHARVRVERVGERRSRCQSRRPRTRRCWRWRRCCRCSISARVLAEAALRALRRVRAHRGQVRVLAAVAALGVAVDALSHVFWHSVKGMYGGSGGGEGGAMCGHARRRGGRDRPRP